MLHRLRMLMNIAGDAPGGGAGGGTPAAPAPPAQGGAVPSIDVNALATQLAGVLGPQIRNSVFADLRKSGVFKGRDPDDQTTTQTPPAPQAGEQPLTQATVAKMLERRDNLAAALDGKNVPARARARLMSDFEREAPGDVAKWVTDYLSDFGLSSGSGGANPDPSRPQGAPVSGIGATPNSQPLGASEDTPLWKLSPEDRAHFLKTKGPKAFRERYYAGLRTARVRVRNY